MKGRIANILVAAYLGVVALEMCIAGPRCMVAIAAYMAAAALDLYLTWLFGWK